MKKTVLITGAAKRIGRSIACDLHQRGWHVIIHYHQSDMDAMALCDALNAKREGSASTWCCGFVPGTDYESECAKLSLEHPQLDALIHNASVFVPSPLAACTPGQWDEVMESNLKSAFFLSQSFYPLLKKSQGVIVHMSDRVAVGQMHKDYMLYALSKAALNDMAQRLAAAYAPEVRVHTVVLGPSMLPEGPQHDGMLRSSRLEDNHLKKAVSMQDIHAAIWYLIDSAKHSTGQVLYVDGEI